MKENISLQELIAINNTSKAKALVVKYGYAPARNYNDLIQKLFRLTKEHREDPPPPFFSSFLSPAPLHAAAEAWRAL